MAYFAGDLDGSGAHPHEAEVIAERGRQFVDEHVRSPALVAGLTRSQWRFEDMQW